MGTDQLIVRDRLRYVEMPPPGTPLPRIDEIKELVASDAGIPIFRMTDKTHRWKYSHQRQVAMHLAVELTLHSLPIIARHFGGVHHTTVLHAHRAVFERMQIDRDLLRRVERLRAELLVIAGTRKPPGDLVLVRRMDASADAA